MATALSSSILEERAKRRRGEPSKHSPRWALKSILLKVAQVRAAPCDEHSVQDSDVSF